MIGLRAMQAPVYDKTADKKTISCADREYFLNGPTGSIPFPFNLLPSFFALF
jgi:hypothetical protein